MFPKLLMKGMYKGLVLLGILAVVLVLSLVAPLDRTPLVKQPFYQQMMAALDTFHIVKSTGTAPIRMGWGRINFTPSLPTSMAGYRPRVHEGVHDSLFARVLEVDNGAQKACFISLDLLLFPNDLKRALEKKMDSAGRHDIFLYVGVTHTHNSIGGWDASLVGRMAFGEYNAQWIENMATSLFGLIQQVDRSLWTGSIAYIENPADEYVQNRLADEKGSTDGMVRGLSFLRADGQKAVFVSWSGHPTSLSSKDRNLSNDYPGSLMSALEEKGYDFSLFMAGMVGSHWIKGLEGAEYALVNEVGHQLAKKVAEASVQPFADTLDIATGTLPIVFGPSQLRIAHDWKLRDWVFRTVIGPMQGSLQCLKIGPAVFISVPCDFSGEVFAENNLGTQATHFGKKLMITSFNGNYTGYVTHDQHYDAVINEEVGPMNWFGPYSGKYYTEMINKLLVRLGKE